MFTKSDYQAIRKHSAQHDVYNRLHSIAKDLKFVEEVRSEWFEDRYPVVANQRCGLWYCDPKTSSDQYAYFKSTDGHTGVWDFSIRRANLHFANFVDCKRGCIIVDSTRRGKRMPDALSKTIPIWCCVLNRAIKKRYGKDGDSGWNVQLYTPPRIVSPTEKSQIEARLDEWAEKLATSSLTLPELHRPLRPIFVTPATTCPPSFPSLDSPEAFTPIICLSASTWIEHGGPEPMRDDFGGFEYVQGSGDDDELWAKGLKPGPFHAERDHLLATPREQLVEVVEEVVSRARKSQPASFSNVTEIVPGSGLYLGVISGESPADFATITLRQDISLPQDDPQDGSQHLEFGLGTGKKAELALSLQVFPQSIELAQEATARGLKVLVQDEDGKDASVGCMMVLLWTLLDDQGELRLCEAPRPSKEAIRLRLQWIQNVRPGANPSRMTLKRVNEFLMSPIQRQMKKGSNAD